MRSSHYDVNPYLMWLWNKFMRWIWWWYYIFHNEYTPRWERHAW